MSDIKKEYTEDSIQSLDWNVHIRQRPGMYIGSTGDGSLPDDGIYILIKEVMDNSVDEYASGFGKEIDVTIEDNMVTIRDFGRGIPLGKVIDVSSKLNTGGKFDSESFQKSVGLNGVGLKAVNATSSYFHIESFRNGNSAWADFSEGVLKDSGTRQGLSEKNGTLVRYKADDTVFPSYRYNTEFIESMIKNYSYLNTGLLIKFNGVEYRSKDGLLDLVNENIGTETEPAYPPIHLIGNDIELVITHCDNDGEAISSFVNGQNTTQGGTHLSAFREAVAKAIKEFYKKDYEPSDIRQSMVGAISVRVIEPGFANQTKTKLSSKDVSKNGPSLRNFIGDFVQEELDNYLHKNPLVAAALQTKIVDNEKIRKASAGIQKSTKEKIKKASLCNKNLRDCRVHYCDSKNALADKSTLFITEGDSASGSITKSRDANVQAVFSLRGKPLNCVTRGKDVPTNEELILLKAALNIEEDLENLRYNKIVIATDADVDGMHIRLLLLTFFLKYYPDLVRQSHVFILQTPLFRVRNKKTTFYCYNDEERASAMKQVGANPEITRFKGLGEISPDEFKVFIGEEMRLDQVRLVPDDDVATLLDFYMGNNDDNRRNFIRENLRSIEVV